jgi:hypothetical protein
MLIDVVKEWLGNRCPSRGMRTHRTVRAVDQRARRLYLRCSDCGRASPGWTQDRPGPVMRAREAGGRNPLAYAGLTMVEDDDVPAGLLTQEAVNLTVLDAAVVYQLWARNRHLPQ